MTGEVQCPSCHSKWCVDACSAGGEMICPSCLTRIALEAPAKQQANDVPVVTLDPPSIPRDRNAARVDPPTRSATPAPSATPPDSGEPQEIVCPRCKLHFMPRRHMKDVDQGSRKTVLVVEDQEYFREIARDALSPTFDVKSAASTDEARAALTGGGIDLLVLDLTLDDCEAGMNLLRELNPKPCPVLIFTAQDESELSGNRWEELRRAGADDLVLKGMQVSESLSRKVGQLLGTPMDEDGA